MSSPITFKGVCFVFFLLWVLPCFPGYFLECLDGIGRDYRGIQSKTNTGKTCQRWDANAPHKPNFWPQSKADRESNFCRNPNGIDGPWCYTTDPNTRWEYCNVKNCSDYILECINGIGRDYGGKKSITNTGKTCQRWDTNVPHKRYYTPRSKADRESNFCRNPNGIDGPWCYTTDPNTRWEYCNVKNCSDYILECINGIGRDYGGKKSITNTGKTCQRWDTNVPHKRYYTPRSKADRESNFCRNPDQINGPWCYTTDPNTRWEYCNVKSCSEMAASSFSAVVMGRSVQVVMKRLCWSDALFYCRDFHWDLLSVRSEEEQREVEKVLRNASFDLTKHVWLGLRRYLRGETWFWMSGDSTNFNYLKTGPFWRETSPCGGIDTSDRFHWRDFPCDEHLHFICLKDVQNEDERVEFYSSTRS